MAGRSPSSRKPGANGAKTATGTQSLSEFQAAFQSAVMDGDDSILGLIPPNSRTDNGVLLGVYRYAYWGRLADIVASDYEILYSYMGDDQFASLAKAYTAACPSHTRNARWFSHRLPEFMVATQPYAAYPATVELARLERALSDAFDAADVPVATLEGLRAIPPEDWEGLVFTPHSSVARLDFKTNALEIWTAIRDARDVPSPREFDPPQRLVIWREDTTSKVREISAEEAMLWDEAAKGAHFGALCELAAVFDTPDTAALRAAQALQGWLQSGMIGGVRR